jgi:catechol 2,3-dioxygenase-like lactoylglutathione lyase family enzyme
MLPRPPSTALRRSFTRWRISCLVGGMVTGPSHATFAVSNLERSLHFYTNVLGLLPVVRWSEGAYLTAGDFWICLTLDPAAPQATNNFSYTHFAFAVTPESFPAMREKLVAGDAEEWQPNSSPGESFYFLDPDGHKLEIHARTLADRLATLRANPKPGMEWLS